MYNVNVYLYENLSYMYPFYIYLEKCQKNACNACALTIYGHGTTLFAHFISSIQVMILPPIGVALPSVGVTVTLHGHYLYLHMHGCTQTPQGCLNTPQGELGVRGS